MVGGREDGVCAEDGSEVPFEICSRGTVVNGSGQARRVRVEWERGSRGWKGKRSRLDQSCSRSSSYRHHYHRERGEGKIRTGEIDRT